MPIEEFRAQNFRCLADVEMTADPRFNLIYGANASGKTSLLEALAYLGRGRSFRGATASGLVRHGQESFVLFGRVKHGGRSRTMGVGNGTDGLQTRVDGESGGGAAALAQALPLQVVDPEVHELVAGAPDGRRRYLDWVAFHVEPGYLETWRRFRRALKQRNAALRDGACGDEIHGWDAEFVRLSLALDAGRRAAMGAVLPALERTGGLLLGETVAAGYRSGWDTDKPLADVLAANLERDRRLGSTQAGPHRADLGLVYNSRQARKLVSRGQQKLLASAMVLAAAETVQEALGRSVLLLLDDPAAELDEDALSRLMGRVVALKSQVVATSLAASTPLFPDQATLFHVEQGRLSAAGQG